MLSLSTVLEVNCDKLDWMTAIISSATSGLDVSFDKAWIEVVDKPESFETNIKVTQP